ncbi:MAG: GAF domain-containing protein [Desulfomonilaceae bacterium]
MESRSQNRAPQIPADKMVLLFKASKAMATTTDLDELLRIVVREVQGVLNCEGAGVLLHDEERGDFYWRTVEDKESFLSSAREIIRVPKDKGVAGWVFRTGEPALIHDAKTDPRIYRPVETRSGFVTRNMVCVPLQAREKRLGVLYALNKEGDFTQEDVEIMSALSGNVALAIENATYYERLVSSHKELERLNKVKTRVLNHLSHELKTPLAIVEASVRILERKIETQGVDASNLPFQRIYRNLDRLKNLEMQVSEIVENRELLRNGIPQKLNEFLQDLIDIVGDQNPSLSEPLHVLKNTIEEMFQLNEEVDAPVANVSEIFDHLHKQVQSDASRRNLHIEFSVVEPATLKIGARMLTSVLSGLVRNAIENTPDHGKIVVRGEKSDEGYILTVQDYGVGIPESERPNIFEGFYPTRETYLYKSSVPYAFNAGGTGTDLLKIKVLAERYGFQIHVDTKRCSCIPKVTDLCPGDINACECCTRTEDCYRNGGSVFKLVFPVHLVENQSVPETQ